MDIDALLSTPSRIIDRDQYRRERWRNGLGWTQEILRLPAEGEACALRLSIATIEQDAAFSRFPGIERELVLLNGNGVRLRFDDGSVREVLPPYGRVRFSGEQAVNGELVDGSTDDFNLMWRPDLLAAQLLHRPLVDAMHFFSEPGVAWAIHLLAGQASFDPDSGLGALQAGDTAWLGAGVRRRYSLHGGGELLAIRVAPCIS